MSVDVAFQGRSHLDVSAVRSWLGSRVHWDVGPTQARYQNPDTGVYMLRDLDDGDASVTASLNVYRPSFFIRELEPELAALVTRFDLVRREVDADGVTRVPYRSDDFVAEWHEANTFAHRAFATKDPVALRADRAVLERVWRWNVGREERQAGIVEDIFVPTIMSVDSGGTEARTAVVWGDGMPIILPDTVFVIIFRDALAPRRRFRRHRPVISLHARESVDAALDQLDGVRARRRVRGHPRFRPADGLGCAPPGGRRTAAHDGLGPRSRPRIAVVTGEGPLTPTA